MMQADRDEIEKMLDKALAMFAGQIMRHTDQQTGGLRSDMNENFDRMRTSIDSLAGRITDDEVERAAIVAEQRRHGKWINELASSTKTKLTPLEEL